VHFSGYQVAVTGGIFCEFVGVGRSTIDSEKIYTWGNCGIQRGRIPDVPGGNDSRTAADYRVWRLLCMETGGVGVVSTFGRTGR
jgi:hypothetical protein